MAHPRGVLWRATDLAGGSALTGVLQARLDVLGSRERSALQQAAVVGHVFWDQALAAIDPGAVDMLPVLLRKQFIVHHDITAFDDTHEYAFQHSAVAAGDVRHHAEGSAPTGSRAGRGILERSRRSRQPPGSQHSCMSRAGGGARPSAPGQPVAFATWFDAQFTNYYNA